MKIPKREHVDIILDFIQENYPDCEEDFIFFLRMENQKRKLGEIVFVKLDHLIFLFGKLFNEKETQQILDWRNEK